MDHLSLSGKKNKKKGGFQTMGLSLPVLKAILKKGYKIPTPIQRKAIPVIMEGKNVIAMARTGSGKTAAFLIPLFEKLKCRIGKTGARALIFSPTRELAMQTMKFTKELGRNTELKAILVLGGEKIENQFASMHESPDIIIATPGRFLHLVVEMDLKLSSVEYVVFDEADRLFEMGFQEQLQEVLNRLPQEKQMCLFSATLPKILVDFVKVGIDDPVLIRLDVDLQISENLKTSYLYCRNEDKPAVLLYLLKHIVDITKELTVVFLATKHHIEYIKELLEKANIPCSYIYSSLDQMARKINISKFRLKKVGVLLVTDIAARGIDIPLLDNVINFNFPAKPKLFVHRVGRVARAGRSGKAYSLISSDEAPYLLDLHLFLGNSLKFAKSDFSDEDGVCGMVPQTIIDEENDFIHSFHSFSSDMNSLFKVSKNAYKQYLKSRPSPSNESIKRIKELSFDSLEIHPLFKDASEIEKIKFLSQMKKFRPNTTIFELGPLAKTQARTVMMAKRKLHPMTNKIQLNNAFPDENVKEIKEKKENDVDESDLKVVFSNVITNKSKKSKKIQKNYKDDENYLSYMSNEHYKEKGLGLESNFQMQASNVVLDFTGDDEGCSKKLKNTRRWDRKKKKFTHGEPEGSVKKMKTEHGVWIPKSYKSDLYKKWQEKNKIQYQNDSENEEDDCFKKNNRFNPNLQGKTRKNQQRKSANNKRPMKKEMRTKEEILKQRKRKARLLSHQKKRQKLKGIRKKNKKRNNKA